MKRNLSMKTILSFILIIIVILINTSFSQEITTDVRTQTHHLITFSSGMSLHSVRDEMMSPLIYSGTQIPIALSYRYRGLSNRHTVALFYDQSDLKSSITKNSSHYIKNLNMSFEYTFSTKAWAFENLNTTCFLGARFSCMLNLRNHYYLKDKSHMSAEQMTGLGIYFLTETVFRKESNYFLRVEVNIPFISYALLNNRYNANVSEKFGDLDFEKSIMWQIFKKGDLVTFNKLFEIQAEISYIFFVNAHFGFDLRYHFQYYSFEQFESLFRANVLSNQFLIGFTVKL